MVKCPECNKTLVCQECGEKYNFKKRYSLRDPKQENIMFEMAIRTTKEYDRSFAILLYPADPPKFPSWLIGIGEISRHLESKKIWANPALFGQYNSEQLTRCALATLYLDVAFKTFIGKIPQDSMMKHYIGILNRLVEKRDVAIGNISTMLATMRTLTIEDVKT